MITKQNHVEKKHDVVIVILIIVIQILIGYARYVERKFYMNYMKALLAKNNRYE